MNNNIKKYKKSYITNFILGYIYNQNLEKII